VIAFGSVQHSSGTNIITLKIDVLAPVVLYYEPYECCTSKFKFEPTDITDGNVLAIKQAILL
jgi:hypothetical protein